MLAFGTIDTARSDAEADVAKRYGVSNPIDREPDKEERQQSSTGRGRFRFIANLEESNEIPLLFETIREISTTQGACINSKAFYLRGDRFKVTAPVDLISFGDEEEVKTPVVDARDREILAEWARNIGGGVSLIDGLEAAAKEWYTQGNVWAECRRVRLGEEGYAFAVELHTSEHCLYVDPEGEGGDPTEVYVSQDWADSYLSKYPPLQIPIYDSRDPEGSWREVDGMERTMIHLKNIKPSRRTYGTPSNMAGRLDAQNEFRIPEHNYWNFENGFSARTILQFVKSQGMTKAKAQSFVNKLKGKFTGQGSERLLVQVVEAEAMLAKAHTLDDAFEGDFKDLDSMSEAKIVRANNWFQILLGNPTAGKLGDLKEFLNTYRIAMATVIRPDRQTLMGGLINPIVTMMLQWMTQSEKPREWQLAVESKDPISIAAEIDPSLVVDEAEAREALGLTGERQGPPVSQSKRQSFSITEE